MCPCISSVSEEIICTSEMIEQEFGFFNYREDCMSKMNIAIIGPGAIGLLFAGLLHRHSEVTLIDHSSERAELFNKNGIRFEAMGEESLLAIPISAELSPIRECDLVLVSVKAYHTSEAARSIKKSGFRGPVLTLQNGLGNVDILARELPGNPLIAGITSEGANIVHTGHVRHAGRGKTSFGVVGEEKLKDTFLSELVELMKNAGFDAELHPDPDLLIWSKLIINVGINALTAIFRVQNGKLPKLPSARELMVQLVAEADSLVIKKGIQLPYTNSLEKVEEVCRMTAENFSSMYQDTNNGRKTEIDFINGAIVREGESLGFPCPLNKTITTIIHAIEEVYTHTIS